ncbi:MAG: amino acid ABC transporter permease [Oscillibacter sp.]|jgi:polar amino acid transport system permease protein|nr:amino acid ABC transporter permease [Oscillibacter sp.]
MGNLISAANFAKVAQYADLFKQGMAVTIMLSLLTVLFGFFLALLLAVMRLSHLCPFGFLGLTKDGHLREQGFLFHLSRFNPVSFIATVYVEVFRATPMLVQLWLVYFLLFDKSVIDLPKVTILGFIRLERFIPGVVALALNSGAYLSEIIRAGIQSIDGGQTEAARSLGLTQGQNMRYVVLPQAIKNTLPAIANEFVTIIKESAITYTIGVQDIMSAVNATKGALYIIIEPLLVATLMYFCLTFPTSKIIAYFERRMSRGDKR